IRPFKSLVLEGLYVEDLQQDTLLYSPKFSIDLNFLSVKARKISVNTVELDQGKFYLKDLKDKTTNLDFIINYFNSGKRRAKKKASRKPDSVTVDQIQLNDDELRAEEFLMEREIRTSDYADNLLSRLNTAESGVSLLCKSGNANISSSGRATKGKFEMENG